MNIDIPRKVTEAGKHAPIHTGHEIEHVRMHAPCLRRRVLIPSSSPFGAVMMMMMVIRSRGTGSTKHGIREHPFEHLKWIGKVEATRRPVEEGIIEKGIIGERIMVVVVVAMVGESACSMGVIPCMLPIRTGGGPNAVSVIFASRLRII